MKLLVYIKPHKQQTYAQHCNKGYITGTLFKHYQFQKVWMKDTHATRVSGAVWFKHKYLTNPSVTPEDQNQIVVAIGGLAKTLTTGVLLQLCDNMVDKLCKLQKILEPRTDGNNEHKITAPTQQAHIPLQSSRLMTSDNHNPAAVLNVAREYAMLPRVLERTCGDTTDRSSPQQPDRQWQLSRIAKLQRKIDAANMGSSNESPEQPGPDHT